MASPKVPSKHLLRSLRAVSIEGPQRPAFRCIATSARQLDQAQAEISRPSFYRNPDPETVFVPRLEKRLVKANNPPIGSRRRRMAIAQSQGLPFDQLPFQCFQEARKILIADREEKLKQIALERSRIARTEQTDASQFRGGELFKQRRLQSLRDELEHLKILADVNDPNVKRRFEDGKGDLNKPIYRYLADRKWREYRRKILVQRITQMKVVPDVIPHCDPIVDIKMIFGRRIIPPGDFVDSAASEIPCRLQVQSFERAEKLVSIAIFDPDVPNLETDSFDMRCHFLASNISITATSPLIRLDELSENQKLVPWLPPTAQKGSPYHRLAIIVFQQKDNIPMDVDVASKHISPEKFTARTFMARHMLNPISATLFRTKWDDNMAGVMTRAGIDGANMELKRIKVEPLPYKRRNPSTFR